MVVGPIQCITDQFKVSGLAKVRREMLAKSGFIPEFIVAPYQIMSSR